MLDSHVHSLQLIIDFSRGWSIMASPFLVIAVLCITLILDVN
jgi:hypothetical protein